MNTITPSNDTSRSTKPAVKAGASESESGLQERIMKQIHDLGDTLERAGERIERSGWEKIGQSISKLGNSLEHLRDGKKTAKPYVDKEFEEKSKAFSNQKSTSASTSAKVEENDSQAY